MESQDFRGPAAGFKDDHTDPACCLQDFQCVAYSVRISQAGPLMSGQVSNTPAVDNGARRTSVYDRSLVFARLPLANAR